MKDTKKLIESNKSSEEIISMISEASEKELLNHTWNLKYVKENGFFLKDTYNGYELAIGWGWHNELYHVWLENWDTGDQVIAEDFDSMEEAVTFAKKKFKSLLYSRSDLKKVKQEAENY